MQELKLKIAPGEGQYLVRTMRRTNEMKVGEAELIIPEEHARQYQMNLCYVEAVGRGRLLPTGERVEMLYSTGDVVIIKAEPQHIPNEVDQELLALADATSITGCITAGLDVENYEIGITLLEEYQNAIAAKAEAESNAAGPHLYQA